VIGFVGILGHSPCESRSLSRVRRERHCSVLAGVMWLSLVMVWWRVCLCWVRLDVCSAGKSKIVKSTSMGR
jgi:hypothetical protein